MLISQAPPPMLGGAQILSVEKLRELLKRLNPQESVQVNALAPEVEESLLSLADDFIHRVTHSAALLAQDALTSSTFTVVFFIQLQCTRQ